MKNNNKGNILEIFKKLDIPVDKNEKQKQPKTTVNTKFPTAFTIDGYKMSNKTNEKNLN